MSSHHEQVRDFMEKCKQENPEEYERVCSKYPVVSSRRISSIKRREATVGLLGLMPARISLDTAIAYDLDPEIGEHE